MPSVSAMRRTGARAGVGLEILEIFAWLSPALAADRHETQYGERHASLSTLGLSLYSFDLKAFFPPSGTRHSALIRRRALNRRNRIFGFLSQLRLSSTAKPARSAPEVSSTQVSDRTYRRCASAMKPIRRCGGAGSWIRLFKASKIALISMSCVWYFFSNSSSFLRRSF